jgi:hypothetical protein
MIVFAALALATTAATSANLRFPHVRTAEAMVRAAIDEGADRSPSFRGLLDRLNDSDVIVHVVWDLRAQDGIAGRLAFVADAGSVRYFRIFVSPSLSMTDLMSVLGHELEHAVEVAERTWIRNQAAMRSFYVSIGISRDAYGDVFDTDEAVDAGDRVRREIAESRHTAFTPVSHTRHDTFIR